MNKMYVEVIGSHYVFGINEMKKEILKLLGESCEIVMTLEEANVGLFILPREPSHHEFDWFEGVHGCDTIIGVAADAGNPRSSVLWEVYKGGNRESSSYGGAIKRYVNNLTGRWFERAVVNCALKRLKPNREE